MGIIRVGGVHGVGKSTLIEKALKISGVDAPVIKGSKIMADFLKISPEELPFLKKDVRGEARQHMYKQLSLFRHGIRDGHFCVYSGQGYEFPLDSREKDYVDAAVVIISSPLRILFRRRKITRQRPLSIWSVIRQQEYEVSAAKGYAKNLGIRLYKIRNNNFDKAAKTLSEIFIEHFNKK